MRQKQRPTKSSRHNKSVTCIINSHTTFGGRPTSSIHSSELLAQTTGTTSNTSSGSSLLAKRQTATYNTSISSLDELLAHGSSHKSLAAILGSTMNGSDNKPLSKTATTPTTRPVHGSGNTTTIASDSSSSSLLRQLQKQLAAAGVSTSSPAAASSSSASLVVAPKCKKTQQAPPTRSIVAANENPKLTSTIMKKQFEHNYRHMSDVMRLAFLENNDIFIDDSNVDFNSQISTHHILQRNMQQQLKNERDQQLRQQRLLAREQQLQFQNQQQQQQRRQQNNDHYNSHKKEPSQQLRHNIQQLYQQQSRLQLHQQALTQDEQDDIITDLDSFEDYDLSDSRIFATAAPHSSTPGQLQHSRPIISITPNLSRIVQNQQQLQHKQQQEHQQQHELPVRGGRLEILGSVDKKTRAKNLNPYMEVDQTHDASIPDANGAFFCDEPNCGKQFPSYRKLRHHLVVHSDEFPYVCQFEGCNKKFKRKFGIDLHSTTHFDLDPAMFNKTTNNSSLPFFGRRMQYSMCKPCNQKFKTVHDYQHHMLKHGKEPFKCPVKGCGQTFNIWKSFQKHRASHYFNYYCKMDSKCDHHTSNLQLLKLHIYCCHFQRRLPENATLLSKNSSNEAHRECPPAELTSEDLSQQGGQSDLFEEEDSQVQQPPFSPEDCHQETAESEAESEPEIKPPTPQTPRRDSRLRKNPPRSGARSTGQQQLLQQQQQQQQHQSPVRGGRPEILGSADKKPRARNLDSYMEVDQTHDASIPDANGAFFCDEPNCGKQFPSYRKLRHHLVVHSDEFPYVCQFEGCNKKFKRKFGIDLHSTTHFDLDPAMFNKTTNNSSLPFFGKRMQYGMCRPCNQKFKTVHDYQHHMLKHGKEPFKCMVKGCGQTFNIWKSFQKHRASHYFNYYCKMDSKCDHHTSNLQLLKLHIYCCHYKRKLPSNATLLSRDSSNEAYKACPPADLTNDDLSQQGEQSDLLEEEDSMVQQTPISREEDCHQESAESEVEPEPEIKPPAPQTPRRDSRLRKNPPRSSAWSTGLYF